MNKRQMAPVISARKIKFENWFKAIPGVHANTIIRNMEGNYQEPEIALVYAAYCAGEQSKLHEIIHIIQNTQQGV